MRCLASAPSGRRGVFRAEESRARVELRADPEGRERIVGTAIVFNVWTTLYSTRFYTFREMIAPEAVDRALADRHDVRGLFNHNPDYILGRTASGTLALSKGERGLGYSIDHPATGTIRDLVVEPIRRGDVSGSSFAFSVTAERITEEIDHENDHVTYDRVILDLDLFDVSPVTYPAYVDTDVALRALESARGGRASARRRAEEVGADLALLGLEIDL